MKTENLLYHCNSENDTIVNYYKKFGFVKDINMHNLWHEDSTLLTTYYKKTKNEVDINDPEYEYLKQAEKDLISLLDNKITYSDSNTMPYIIMTLFI